MMNKYGIAGTVAAILVLTIIAITLQQQVRAITITPTNPEPPTLSPLTNNNDDNQGDNNDQGGAGGAVPNQAVADLDSNA